MAEELDELLGALDDALEEPSSPGFEVSASPDRSASPERSRRAESFYSAADRQSWAPVDDLDVTVRRVDSPHSPSTPTAATATTPTPATPTVAVQPPSPVDDEEEIRRLEARLAAAKAHKAASRASKATPNTSSASLAPALAAAKAPSASSSKPIREAPIDFTAPTVAPAPTKAPGKAAESAAVLGEVSSDEEGGENEEQVGLSDEGRGMRRALGLSNSTADDLPPRAAAFDKVTVRKPPTPKADKPRASGVKRPQPGSGDPSVFSEFFGLRVRNPLLSSAHWEGLLEDVGDKVRLGELCGGRRRPDGTFATMGVVAEKSGTRTSVNGNSYAIWTLTELKDMQSPGLKLWLFGEALKKHWKIGVGSVVGLLSPALMDEDKDKAKKASKAQPFSVKVFRSGQVVELGLSPDLGTCRGTNKTSGKACTNAVNRQASDLCPFHLVAAHKSFAARRGALQGSGPPTRAPNHSTDRFGASQVPRGLTVGAAPKGLPKRTPLTLEAVRKGQKHKPGAPVPAPAAALAKAPSMDKDRLLDEVLAKPGSPGARNLLAQLTKSDSADSLASSQSSAAEKAKKAANGMEFLKSQATPRIKGIPRRQPMLGRGWRLESGPGPNLTSGLGKEEKRNRAKDFMDAKAKARAAAKLADAASAAGLPKAAKPPKAGGPSTARSSPSTRSPVKKAARLGARAYSAEEAAAILGTESRAEREAAADKEAAYFALAEASEAVEKAAAETTELRNVKVVTCKACGYTAAFQSELCRSEGHLVLGSTATKRFFACGECGTRTAAFGRLPAKACRKCGANSWAKAGLKAERKGPATLRETLKLRGDEEKFLGR